MSDILRSDANTYMYVLAYIDHAQDNGFVGKPEGLEELGVDGRILLK
jgi:hypothetical protein